MSFEIKDGPCDSVRRDLIKIQIKNVKVKDPKVQRPVRKNGNVKRSAWTVLSADRSCVVAVLKID